MKTTYIVIYTGKMLPDADIPNVVDQVASMFNIAADRARAFLFGNQAFVVKKDISLELAEQYRARMTAVGLETVVQEYVAKPVIDQESVDKLTGEQLYDRPVRETLVEAVSALQAEHMSVALWNPNAAVNWSFLLSPAFGAYLHMRNWEALGEDENAANSRRWFYLCLVVFFAVTSAFIFLRIKQPGGLFGRTGGVGYVPLISLLLWYYLSARKQAKYIKARFGKKYPRKPWLKMLAIAFGCEFGCTLVLEFIIILLIIILKL